MTAIIVNFNSVKSCLALIDSLSSCKPIGDIILVDNSVTDESQKAFLEAFKKNNKAIYLPSSTGNMGFAKAVNFGLKWWGVAESDRFLLVNPDVKVSNFQIETLYKTAGDIVSPVLSYDKNGVKTFDFGGKINFLIGRASHLETADPDEGKRKFANKFDYLTGACLLINKKVFDTIGFFDERFFMYFEDVDFCLRAKKAGFSLVLNSEVIVGHALEVVKETGNKKKLKYNLTSNLGFIRQDVPIIFKPTAFIYWLLLLLKTGGRW